VRARQWTPPAAYHGESPVWWRGELNWVDLYAGDILSGAPEGPIRRRHVGNIVTALRPRRSGGFVYALERSFGLAGPNSDQRPVETPELWDDSTVRFNDGGCDPDGRFYCGSMAYDERPGVAVLVRLDPDLSVHTVLTGVSVSNGLDWSPDGRLAYYVDTLTRSIDVFDYDYAGGLANRRPFVVIDEGYPDGITVDGDGGVWVAIWGQGEVRRYDPDSRLTEVVELPVSQASACAFGGIDLDELFITTSREGLARDEQPSAGAVFVVEPGVRGQETRCFAD
jgi:sugar lactone lactonase YvrE